MRKGERAVGRRGRGKQAGGDDEASRKEGGGWWEDGEEELYQLKISQLPL